MSYTRIRIIVGGALVWMVLLAACERPTEGLKAFPLDTDPVVFADGFAGGLDYQAFLYSKLDALSIDTSERFEGTAAIKVTVPPPGGEAGFAGGALTTSTARDLSRYNALTFWAKSSVPSTLNVVGLGNDNTGTSLYEASIANVPLTTAWSKVVVPVPFPARLSAERGLMYFAEEAEGPDGHTVWFDQIQFEEVSTISNPRPVMASRSLSAFVGGEVEVSGTEVTFDVGGSDLTVVHQPAYLTYFSSDTAVATAADGVIRAFGAGEATITARLGEVDVVGEVTLQATAPPFAPAPPPGHSPGQVISIFSGLYTDITVDTWSADWDRADYTELEVDGDLVKAYTNLVFAGIEFNSAQINAADMTHFHMDVWVSGGTQLKVKLVDFGEDGVFGGAPDAEHELTFGASSTPPIVPDTWVSLDVPLADFTRLITREHLAQLIVSGQSNTVYVDNIYFHGP